MLHTGVTAIEIDPLLKMRLFQFVRQGIRLLVGLLTRVLVLSCLVLLE